MLDKLWLIPILPFAGFLLNGLFGKRAGKGFVTAIALLATLAAAILGTVAVIQYNGAYHHGERHLNVVYELFHSGGIGADIAFQLDPLSIVMLMVVTWVGFLIHLYSVGYMHHEEGYWRYFAYLNLFLSAMLILILGSSYLFMFVGWEGVGLCSYLLIGFYYETDYAPAAGKKAFIVNRIADFGFLVAMFLMFAYIGSVDFARVSQVAAGGGIATGILTAICLLLFDIKKVLAYSTVSQLGFMFIGVGVGAFSAGVFHLVTHAFFKACLFLGSGSVIHAMSGEQDVRNMGGLKSKIPITFWTFLIATIAIAGFPPFAGFFSKDEILASAFVTPYFPGVGKFIWLLGTLAAFCTAFYMYRLVYLTFYGSFRGTHEQEHHLHESPPTMTIPLIVLAALSAVGGALGLPHVIGHNFLGEWLGHVIPEVEGTHAEIHIPASSEWTVMIISTLVAIAGWFLAMRLYKDRGLASDQAFEQRAPGLAHAIENKWYVDELYAAIIVRPLAALSRFFWKGVDAVIDGIAAMLGFVIRGFGEVLRFFQTGNVRNYALMFFIGVVVFLAVFS